MADGVQPNVNQRRSSFVIVSVTAHAVLLSGILAVSMLAPALLPSPARALLRPSLFADRLVRMADVDLPTSKAHGGESRSPSRSARSDLSTNAAPVEPPAGFGPETTTGTTIDRPSGLDAVEGGGGKVEGVGIAEASPVIPADQAPVRLHSGIEAPRKVLDAAPAYPEIARASRVQGVVILEVTIDERGNVGSARVLRSIKLLDQAALEAVERWTFTPARLNGQTIPVVMTVTVNFQLGP